LGRRGGTAGAAAALRSRMSTSVRAVIGYVAAVLGVIAIASVAVFDMRGMAAKTHRHWDADIDRIVAHQQIKRHLIALASAETPDVQSDAGPPIAGLTTEPLEAEENEAAVGNESGSQKVQNRNGKKYSRRADRRRQAQGAPANATLPNLAAVALAPITLFRLR
jgi:hypothetical protein